MASLAEELPNQITRVRGIQDRFKAIRGMPNTLVEPQIMMMEYAIQQAISACASGDVIEMIRCLEDLKSYED